MVQAGNDLGFALEPLLTYRIGRKMCGQNLDSYDAVEPLIFRAVNLAHPARADRAQDLVGPNRTPRDRAIWQQFYTE